MKRGLKIFLFTLIISSLLASCGGGGTPPPATGVGGGSGLPDVTDGSIPLLDPVPGSMIGSVSSADLAFLAQQNLYYNRGNENYNIADYMPNWQDVVAEGRSETSVYGIYAWVGEFSVVMDDLIDIGFQSIRSTGVINEDAKWDSGKMDDSKMETQLLLGVDVMGCSSGDMRQEWVLGTDYQSLDNYNVSKYLEFHVGRVLEFLKRYGPDGDYFKENPDLPYNPVDSIEIMNEPNFGYLLTWPGHGANESIKAQLFAMLQITKYYAIKNAYGDDVTVVGGSFGGEQNELHFLYKLMELQNSTAMADYLNTVIRSNDTLREYMGLEENYEDISFDYAGTMDVLSIHPYYAPSPFATNGNGYSFFVSVAKIREELRKYIGYDIDVWFTECGWQLKGRNNVQNDMTSGNPTYDWGDYEYNANDWGWVTYGSGVTTGVDQLTQAAMSIQLYIYGLRADVDFISYMHLFDTDGCNYGIFNYISSGQGDLAWRKVCYAIQTMTTLMPDPVLSYVYHEGNVDYAGGKTSDTKYYIYEFESQVGGEKVITAFAAQDAMTIPVPWDEEYALVTDLFGTTKIVAAKDGYIQLDGGPYVMYVRHVDHRTLIENGIIPNVTVSESALTAMVAWVESKDE